MYIKINENNRVIMQIKDKFAEGLTVDNKVTFRVQGVEIPPIVEQGEYLCYDSVSNAFYTEKVEITEEQIAKAKAISEARAKKNAALKWLADNDWKVNKRVLGEWSEEDPRWQEYVEGRIKARADIDEADTVINSL